MKTIEHDALCEASARSRLNLTLWGAELMNGCGCANRITDPPELESFASGEPCSTCEGAGDIFTNPTWNNDPQFEEDHPCEACGGTGVDPGPRWPTR